MYIRTSRSLGLRNLPMVNRDRPVHRVVVDTRKVKLREVPIEKHCTINRSHQSL
jgi:hypothetical protein